MVSDLWSKNFPTERGKIRSQIKDKNKEQVGLNKCLLTEWETDVKLETEIEDTNFNFNAGDLSRITKHVQDIGS